MNSRAQHRRCGAWATSPVAALCVAVLGMLLIAVAMCPGSTTHTPAGPQAVTAATAVTAARPVTATTTEQAPADGRSATHHAITSAHPGDCHSGDGCCARSAHGGPAVVPAAPQPLPVVLPCSPAPVRPTVTAHACGLPPARSAPDLHVLKVQRI
ncbi:hypothetical protein PYK79_34105 [Streptomyces sp. ID05-04B]|uniref:hypothetical protein n=1 Tax=Streptomyces sp. ID05-04B TaxID=3028661 RepID=UPI0029C505F7|nr:hypothetical protein [Streptomyces sp. ID05-04B]MDX5567295.1 hypothetical protein [Streptomyces sp. ID05-04B]